MDMSLRLHGGIEPRAKQMMENIGSTLRANGLSLDDEVHCDACRHVQMGRVQPTRFELVVYIEIIARDVATRPLLRQTLNDEAAKFCHLRADGQEILEGC
jgi:hypothetical protein